MTHNEIFTDSLKYAITNLFSACKNESTKAYTIDGAIRDRLTKDFPKTCATNIYDSIIEEIKDCNSYVAFKMVERNKTSTVYMLEEQAFINMFKNFETKQNQN